MPGQGRLGDKAQSNADAHGCPACPHPSAGPAISGSSDVRVNGKPALRVDDQGVHAACCGGNRWQAAQGSRSVFINGKPAHRIGDATRHCGSTGRLFEGSGDVLVGDDGTGPGAVVAWIAIRLCDRAGAPLAGVRFRLITPDGQTREGVLSDSGEARILDIKPGMCKVSFPGLGTAG
jgi:uncharacterized Zn-binding protein involved in type VI secretion